MMIKKICEQCGKEFLIWPYEEKALRKYCSKECAYNGINYKPNRGTFKKGLTPWNKDTKGIYKPNITSFKKGHIPWMKGRSGKPNKGSFGNGYRLPISFNERIRNGNFNEWRKKQSEAHKGMHHKKETKIKISKASQEHWHDDKILFNIFKSHMFGKNYNPNDFDKEITLTRVRLHKVERQSKAGQ